MCIRDRTCEALAQRGDAEEGIAEMRRALAAHRAAGAEMGRPSHLALLAEAEGRAGRPEEALRVLDEALATVAQTGECSYEAELHRLKGELLSATGREAEGRRCLEGALALARRQGARSLELRAALSLAGRGRGRPRTADERRLRDVCASFTEGFETADLRAARSLLAGPAVPRA